MLPIPRSTPGPTATILRLTRSTARFRPHRHPAARLPLVIPSDLVFHPTEPQRAPESSGHPRSMRARLPERFTPSMPRIWPMSSGTATRTRLAIRSETWLNSLLPQSPTAKYMWRHSAINWLPTDYCRRPPLSSAPPQRHYGLAKICSLPAICPSPGRSTQLSVPSHRVVCTSPRLPLRPSKLLSSLPSVKRMLPKPPPPPSPSLRLQLRSRLQQRACLLPGRNSSAHPWLVPPTRRSHGASILPIQEVFLLPVYTLRQPPSVLSKT